MNFERLYQNALEMIVDLEAEVEAKDKEIESLHTFTDHFYEGRFRNEKIIDILLEEIEFLKHMLMKQD